MEPTGWEMRPMGWIALAIFTVLVLYLLKDGWISVPRTPQQISSPR